MITLSKYTYNNSLYLYFVFSFFYNLLLSFFIDETRYNIEIIILNIFLSITVYCFGNRTVFRNRELWDIISTACFNISIFFFIAGNWMLAFIMRILFPKKKT